MENTTTTTMTTTITLDDIINDAWKQAKVIVSKEDLPKIYIDTKRLKCEGITMQRQDDGSMVFSRQNPTIVKMESHQYIMPSFVDEVRCLVGNALNGDGMANLLLTGALGTGKTEFIYELAKEYGVKVYQVNGSEGLTSADFYGTMSVGIDEKSKQNYTFFDKGPLYRAFIEGTKLDENGNQVFDENGDPIVIGKPAFFFLDEFAAMLPEVFLAVFNRALEIPRKHGKGRSIEVTMDNGRVVKSHPGLVIFLAGNTVGTGNNGRYQMGYTAQSNKMDESTRNRITATYQFGYNKTAEATIVSNMLNDDMESDRLLRLRDNLRNLFKRGDSIETLFSTRAIVAICETAVKFRRARMENWMIKALRTSLMNLLPENDKPAFNETIRSIWSYDIMGTDSRKNDMDVF